MTDWIADFGRTAADYDQHRPGFPESLYVRLASLGWIRRGLRTLDVGTGTGSLALGLAQRGLDVVGIDPAPGMLDVAGRRAQALGVDVRFREGTAEDTGLETASLDLVTAGHCWWWLDTPRTMAEVKRVLVPGGRLLIANFSYLPMAGGAAAATERLILAHNPRWPKSGESGVFEDQLRDLDVAGLGGVESFSYVEPVTFTHEGWRGRIRACSGVGASLDPAAVEALDRDLTRLLAASFPAELLIPHRVFVVTGRTDGP